MVNKCSKCGCEYTDDDFDFTEDMCLYCVFPEAARLRPAAILRDYGYPRNVTPMRELLDNLDRTPEKQSKEATRRLFHMKNYEYVYQKRKVYK